MLQRIMTSPRQGAGGYVRVFERDDIPGVCALFSGTFRRGKLVQHGDLGASLESTYLSSPSYRPDRGSLVHVDAMGQVDGFMGIINLTMRLGDRSLHCGILSAFMARDPEANPGIGVQLVRATIARPFDMLFTDTANGTSLGLARAVRFSVLPTHSLEWTKILRFGGTAGYLLARRLTPLRRPIIATAAAIDRWVPALAPRGVDPRIIERSLDRVMDASAFVAAAPRFIERFALRPAWHPVELSWFMAQAALRTKNGDLHIREVLDRRGRMVGLYLLYARRGGVAYALQVLAQPGREEVVIGNVIRQAALIGAVAVRGAASPAIVGGLLRQSGIFYRQIMSTIVRSNDAEATEALRAGDVFLGGLAGETWSRLFADEFAPL